MLKRRVPAVCCAVLLMGRVVVPQNLVVRVEPGSMPRVATVSDRFQSYNVEMAEVTGGNFWKPYDEIDAMRAQKPEGANQPTGLDPNLFQYRPPIDLSNVKLRRLAAALGPAYIRVSGTWQNSTYFQNNDAPAPATPPSGFNGVLTRAEWRGVIEFARAVNAEIITSVATSGGTRDANDLWTSSQAEQFFDYTRQASGAIAATEFMNEPSFAQIGGAPKGYDGAAFGRDIAVFSAFLRKAAPGTVFLGPGSVGEGIPLAAGSGMSLLPSSEMLKATGPVFDAFSYHFYGGVSARCRGGLKADEALSSNWLDRTDIVEAFYGKLRDRYLPGKPLWLTETGEAACGGDPWASTFLDSFRYLNQLGSLAKRGVQVVAHNTLAASDYALLDPKTLDPRPNYWAALLWRRLMGTTVLDAGQPSSPNLYVYAQCLRGTQGGITLLAINTDAALATLEVPQGAQRYTLTATAPDSKQVLLNGKPLILGPGDTLPSIAPVISPKGPTQLAPRSITFFTIAGANNPSCRA